MLSNSYLSVAKESGLRTLLHTGKTRADSIFLMYFGELSLQ